MREVKSGQVKKRVEGKVKVKVKGDIFWTPEDPSRTPQQDIAPHRVYQTSDISATVWKHRESRRFT